MNGVIGLIGFGEAGRTFAKAGGWAQRARVFDRKTDDPVDAPAMRHHYADAAIVACESLRAAVEPAGLILSLVTADQALAAAQAAAACIAPDACFCDLNSVAPQTKRAAAAAIEAAGAHYIDVAVMAPVDPAGLAVPLLIAGPNAAATSAILSRLGFTDRRVVGDAIGRAAAIKMIRSIMVKGMEALTAECLLAADAAGVLDEVIRSIAAGEQASAWRARADYNFGRMMVHGLRRAAEMDEVARTVDGLRTGSAMARATAERQRAIGRLALHDPAADLAGKLAQIRHREGQAA